MHLEVLSGFFELSPSNLETYAEPAFPPEMKSRNCDTAVITFPTQQNFHTKKIVHYENMTKKVIMLFIFRRHF